MEDHTKVAAFNCPNCGAAVAPDCPSCAYCGSAIATRLCPACFGAVSIGMRHCPHCGAEVVDSSPSKTEPLRCPRCAINLDLHSIGQNSISACSKCGGIWADKDDFQNICTREEEQEAVLAFQPQPANTTALSEQKPRRAYIPCPECGNLMNCKNFSGSGIVLDWCRDHGCWLDRNELQQIVRFIKEGGLRKAREREQQKLKDQEDKLRMQEFTMAALDRRLDSNFARTENPNKGDLIVEFLSKMFW